MNKKAQDNFSIRTAEPGDQLYSSVRASFVANGTSLHKWCGDTDLAFQNARAILLGHWKGEKATKHLKKILVAANG